MAFAHGLQQRRLRLGRRAVDLVSQHQVGKNRPGDKSETPAATVAVLVHHFRAKNVSRHQIRRELDTLEAQREKLRNALDQQGLAQSRHARQQRMTTSKHGDDDLLNDLALANYDLAQLRP